MNCEAIDFMCQFFALENFYLWGTLLFLLLILILLLRRQPGNIIAYKTENGDVVISRSAVIELVRTSCEQISQVSKPKLKVFTKRGLTHFTIRIQLTSGGRLKDVEETLQNHLRESLSKNLGIEKLGNINIIVTSFKSSKIRPIVSDSLPKVPKTLTYKEEEFDLPTEETESDEQGK